MEETKIQCLSGTGFFRLDKRHLYRVSTHFTTTQLFLVSAKNQSVFEIQYTFKDKKIKSFVQKISFKWKMSEIFQIKR